MSAVLYFISDINMINLFRENEIPVLEQMEGLTFPEEYREKSLEVLNWNPDQVKEIPTSEWSIDQLVIDWPTDELKVQRDYNHPSHQWWEYLELVCQWCQNQELPWPVVVHYTKERHTLYENGKIHLCFGGDSLYPMEFWIHQRKINYQRHHLWIGELGPEHSHCRELIPALLEESLAWALGQEKGLGKEKFVLDKLERLTSKRREITNELISVRRSVRRLQAQLIETLRKKEELQTQLEQANRQQEPEQDKFEALFEQLKNRNYLKQVIYRNGVILGFTQRIIIDLPEGDLYDIGNFSIEINTTIDPNKENTIILYNLTRQGPPDHSHHPHVDRDGHPCLGSVHQVVAQYISREKYPALFDVLYNYLRSTNTRDSRGAEIVHWPRFC